MSSVMDADSSEPTTPTPSESKTGDPRFDALPPIIRKMHEQSQFAWLSDREKDTLMQTSLEPENT